MFTGSICSSEDQPSALHIHGTFGDDVFELTVGDRDTLEALRRFPSPAQGVEALLTVGACAALATSTGFNIQQVQQEIDRHVTSTIEALKTVREHVSGVIGDDGPLAAALAKTRVDLDAALRDIVTRQGDPEVPGSLTARLQGIAKRLDETITTTRTQLTQDLQQVNERQAEYIGKAIREMRDLDPASALGVAFGRLEKQLVTIGQTLAASQAAAAERQRGTAKGGDYESLVVAEVAAIAAAIGDRAEHTGTQPGAYISKQRPSLRGDVTATIMPEALENPPKITVEAMDRGQVTARQVDAELDEAMANRDAQAAIAVISSAANAVMCGQHFIPLAPNKFVVVLAKDQPSAISLQIAYRLARHVVLAAATQTAAVDCEQMKTLVEEVNNKLALLAMVKAPLTNIATCQEQAMNAIAKAERELRAAINRLLDALEMHNRPEAA